MIDKVFGIGTIIDIDGEKMPCIFISNKKAWKNKKCCIDIFKDNSYKVLSNLGFVKERNGIWNNINTDFAPIDYHRVLTDAGFTYNKDFEIFMQKKQDEE